MQVREINTKQVDDVKYALMDMRIRQLEALYKYANFFEDHSHLEKVEAVKSIVKNFFKIKRAVYVNYRANKGIPFTAVKVSEPDFPNSMPRSEIQKLYYEPLEKLGVEIVHAKSNSGASSYIYRVR